MNNMQFRFAPLTDGAKESGLRGGGPSDSEGEDGKRGLIAPLSAVLATNHPVQRRDARGPYLEILDPAGLLPVDDVPLLTDHRHEARASVGRVTGITIDGDSVVGTLTLGTADDLQPIAQRLADGTLRHVSVGYSVAEWAEGKDANGNRTKTATRWALKEVSIVPIPADPNAKITKRSEETMNPEELKRSLTETLGLRDGWADDLPEDADEAAIREAAKTAFAGRAKPQVRIVADHTDPAQIAARATDALVVRMVGGDCPDSAREFVGMSFKEHAVASLQRAGVSTRGMSTDDVFSQALSVRSGMSTSDLPLVVSNAMGKVSAQAYQAAESSLKQVAKKRVLPNFKESTSIRIGELGQLQPLSEHGEFTATSRAESGEKLQLGTFGRRIDVSRKLLIDDDLGLLGDMASALGQAAAQTEASLLVNLLTSNPLLSDGGAVFSTARKNLTTDALSTATLDLARATIRSAKGLDGKTPIAATPRYLVVGIGNETNAEVLLTQINAARLDDVNPMAGKFQLLVEPRIADGTFYVLADPAKLASLQMAYLASAQGVQIQRQESWDTLGISYRAWLDFGAGWLDYRGAFKGAFK